MIGDTEPRVATACDMLPEGAGTISDGPRPRTVRSVFVIGPDKKIKAMLTYPMSPAATSTRSCGCATRAS